MRSVDGCSEDEVSLFGVIAFVSIVASISDLAASIFLPTLFLSLIFLRLSWNDVVSEEICFSLFNEFWWKLGICLYENLDIVCDTKSIWSDINQLFLLFVKTLFRAVKHGLDGGVNDIFSQERWRLGGNGGGSSRDSDVLIGYGSYFLDEFISVCGNALKCSNEIPSITHCLSLQKTWSVSNENITVSTGTTTIPT